MNSRDRRHKSVRRSLASGLRGGKARRPVAWADVTVLDCNPLEDIALLANPEPRLASIMEGRACQA